MAEVKKSLKLQKLADKSLNEFSELVGSPEGKPEGGSVSALAAALSANLALLASSACAEGSVPAETVAELPELQKYMLKQVDDYVRSRSPLRKRLAEGDKTPEEIESAARVACGIPNEVVYLMCRNLEMLDQIADVCPDEMVSNVLTATHLALAVIASMRGEIKFLSQYMMEFTFQYTVNREAEINVQEHQELVDGLLEKLQKRLNKES